MSGSESPPSLVEIVDREQVKTCTEMTPIPLPADDYNHEHGIFALLASLSAMAASTDASFDTISDAIRRIEERIRSLSSRVAVFRENIAKLDKKGEKIVLLCPESYDEMLESARAYLESMKGRIELVRARSKGESSSLMEAVRRASNDAVKASLRRDNLQDDGNAVPTDSWLDSAEMGVGAGRAARVAARQMEVPPCLGAVQPRVDLEDAEYMSMLDGITLGSGASGADRRASLAPPEERGESAFQDDASVISALSTVTAATSSGRVTSRQRRRMQKEQQRSRALGAMVKSQHSATSTTTVDGTDAGRQSAMNPFENVQSVQGLHLLGSQYLCDNLHDTYGVDMKGSSNVSDLLVFNTSRRAAS